MAVERPDEKRPQRLARLQIQIRNVNAIRSVFSSFGCSSRPRISRWRNSW